MTDRLAQQVRFTREGLSIKVIRWAAFPLLLWIGLAGARSLIDFSRAAAIQDTYGFSGAYTAARLAVLGEATGSLQNWDWFREQTRRYGFKATDIYAGNPPSAALLMMPIARLPQREARIVWTWLSLAFWGMGIGALGVAVIRYAETSRIYASAALLCLATLYAPVRANIEEGQVYVFAFLLQSLCCWFWLSKRSGAAGAFGGALLALKGYGVPLIVLGILRRDWKFVGAAAGVFTAFAALAGAMLGFRQWSDFIAAQQSPLFSGIPTPALQTLKSLLILALHLPTVPNGPVRTVTPSADQLLFALQAIIGAALLLWLSEIRLSRVKSRSSVVPPLSLAVLSACVLLNLVLSPRAEEHAYPLAMTALILMIPQLQKVSIVTLGVIVGGVLLSWPFHLQDRTVISTWHLFSDFARLWGAVLLLAAAVLAEYLDRRRLQPVASTWEGAHVACALGIALVLWYTKPWRDPVKNGPLIAVSRTDANKVTLVRLDLEEREVSTVPLTCKGPFGLAFTLRRDWLYATCWDNSQIGLIDLKSRRESMTFRGARLPAWAQLRPGSDEMWISNEGAGKVTVYAAGASTVLSEIATGSGPSDIAFARDGSRAWVGNEGSRNVSLINAENRQKIGDIPVGEVPQGMALTRNGGGLLVANFGSNTVSVLDTANSRELGQIPVCRGPVDVATSRSEGLELGYVSCFQDGSVGVVDIDRRQEIQRISVGEKPFGIAAHPNGGRVYVCVGGSNRVVVLETGRPSRILRRMMTEGNPLQIAVVR